MRKRWKLATGAALVLCAAGLVHPALSENSSFSNPPGFSGGLPAEMLLAFLVCLVGMALLWTTLVWFELDTKAASANLGRIRRALEAAA